MIKAGIGFITNNRELTDDDSRFKKIAKKLGIKLYVVNIAREIDRRNIEKKLENCGVVYNDEIDATSLEVAKQLEMKGFRVIESTRSFYYTEDKWILYLKCAEAGIPTPKTRLMPTNIKGVKKELKKFAGFPIVLKRAHGCRGDFVDKGDDIDSAIKIVKKFWKKGGFFYPIIAQEFVRSQSYRVLTIGGEVAQTALKKSKGWKATGNYCGKFEKFQIDEKLADIIKRVGKAIDIQICGIDFARKDDGSWLLIEVNAQPELDFFPSEFNIMIEKILIYLSKINTL